MTPLPMVAVNALAERVTPTPNDQPRPLPFTVRMIRNISDVGALTAVATLVYGIAMNVFGFIAMGVIFLLSSLSSLYLIHQIADLKTIEQDTDEIKTLDSSLALKNSHIQQLTLQIKDISQKFATQEKEFIQLAKKNQVLDRQLNEQLQQSANTLAKTQADAQQALDQTSRQLNDQILALQQRSEKDQKTIAAINQAVAKAGQQVASLKTVLTDLQQQIISYKEQNAEYSRLNTQLQLQLKTLTEAARSPELDLSTIDTHAAKIEESIAQQKAQAARTAQTAAQISTMLDALSRQIAKKTTGK